MDITLKTREQIVAVRQHSNMTMRKIGEELNVSKSSVGQIFKIKDSDVTKTQRRGRSRRKRKTTSCNGKMILQNSFKNPRKNSKDLH